MLSGFAEPAHLNDFMFEQQRRTFSTFGSLICNHLTRLCKEPHYADVIVIVWFLTFFPLLTGYALDPSVDSNQISSNSFIGAVDEAEKNKGNDFFYHLQPAQCINQTYTCRCLNHMFLMSSRANCF